MQLGLVSAAQFIPILILGPWAGVLVDRFPKRKLLYFTQIAFGILALVLGVLVATGAVQLWMVYILAFLFGIVTMIDNPTRQTFIVEMVGEDQLPNAVALNSSQFNLARVVGPAIGGGLIAAVGLAPCFFINAFSFAAVLAALFMMRGSRLFAAPLATRAKGQLAEGFRYVKSAPILRDTLIMMAIIGTLTYEFSVILPLLAQFTFKGGAGAYAALSSAMGFGAIFGGLYAATRNKGTAISLIKTAFLFGAVILLASIMPNLTLAIVALVAVGFFSVSFTSLGNVMLQLESSPEMRGRVMALWSVAFLGSTPIGGPIIGYIAQYANPRWGLAVGGLAAVFAAALGYWRLCRDRKPTVSA
jgi:MFS family permease